MIKAVIGKNNVAVYHDNRKVVDIWGDKIKVDTSDPESPFISVYQKTDGYITFVHPDQIEFKSGEGPENPLHPFSFL